MALGALARLAEAIIYTDVDISAKFEYRSGVSADIRVNPGNAMILQKTEVCLQLKKEEEFPWNNFEQRTVFHQLSAP